MIKVRPMEYKERTHVEIEYSGEAPVTYNVGDKPLQLKPGHNLFQIGLWHALGGTPEGQALLASGLVRPVCTNHDFPVLDDGITPHPQFPACRKCGCDRKGAALLKKQRAYEKTAAGKAELAKARAEREAALAEHAKEVAKAVAAESGAEPDEGGEAA